MEDKLKKAKDILKKYNQEHLLQEYNKLDDAKKEKLLSQILNIDFEQIKKLYENTKKEIKLNEEKIEPINYIEKQKLTKEEKKRFFNIGAGEIKKGNFAVVTMAGRTRDKIGTYWTKRKLCFKC